LEAFARASGDVNPIHLEGAPAPASPFEAPVAYGALAALIAAGKLIEDSDRGLQVLDAIFARPLRAGAEYDIEVQRDSSSRIGACVRDGDLPALTLEARFSGGGITRTLAMGEAERLSRPLHCSIEDLETDTAVQGSYSVDEASLRWIRERFRLQPSAIDDRMLYGLLFASYLVGMVIPGSGSMMSRLRVSLAEETSWRQSATSGQEPLSYQASVVDLRQQVRMVTLAGELQHLGQGVARLTCEAHLPPPPVPLDLELLESELGGKSSAFEGRAAIVVGASRGLGAALAHGLASQGCLVYASSRSGEEREPSSAPSWKSAIHHVQGDASDPEHCQRLLELVEDRHGNPDFVICCGAPRLEGIGFGPTSARRFNSFVQESVELVSVPLATMIRAVEAKAGTCVVVSSEAVNTMPRDWGHYVAAKGASEALAVWAAKRFPRIEMVVARVPQLDGRQLGIGRGDGVVMREAAAAWLVRRLKTQSGAGAHLLEWPHRSPS
jgi:hypothetical protein